MSMFKEKMKDSRFQREKDCFQQRIKVLHKFLLGLGFPGTINVKSLHTTAPEDFLNLTEFFRCFSESSFQFPTYGVEEEIPKLLKDLRYPVAVSNLPVYSVKDSNFLHQFLGATWLSWIEDWLVNWHIVKTMCQAKEKESSSPCDVEEGAEFNEPLMEYCRDTYTKFLEGTDTIEEKDEALINQLLQRLKTDKQHFISSQENRRMMMEEAETMERECQESSSVASVTQDKRDRKALQNAIQSLTRTFKGIEQLLSNNSDSHTELEGNGAAGVERGGAKTRKSQSVKKVRRKRRK